MDSSHVPVLTYQLDPDEVAAGELTDNVYVTSSCNARIRELALILEVILDFDARFT
jgi:hypothetical protein